MPEKRTVKRAAAAKRAGKAPTTQAGEYVREEMEHKKRGKHPVKNRKQAIAIGLSKARESGVKVPAKGTKKATKKAAKKTAKKAVKKAAPKKAARKATKKATKKSR